MFNILLESIFGSSSLLPPFSHKEKSEGSTTIEVRYEAPLTISLFFLTDEPMRSVRIEIYVEADLSVSTVVEVSEDTESGPTQPQLFSRLLEACLDVPLALSKFLGVLLGSPPLPRMSD